jgi:hypothetical protein
MTTDAAAPRQTPPYFAFKTLLRTLEDMEEHGPPPRLDRSYLRGMSGAGQTQFLGGLRSLGLIDAEGNAQDSLRALVAQKDQRPQLMAQLIEQHYAEAVELGKTNATTGQLQDVFRDVYNAKGDTARKAIAFFLQAAEYAGVKVSPNFKTPSTPRSNGASRRKPKTQDQDDTPLPLPLPPGDIPADLHPALAGMLKEIPKQGSGWESEERRDQFKQAFQVALDFLVPVTGPAKPAAPSPGDEEPEA